MHAGDEPIKLSKAQFDALISIVRTVYGGGYIENKMTWDQKKELRGRAYRVLKELGVEK